MDLTVDTVAHFVGGEVISDAACVSYIVTAAEFWTQLKPDMAHNIMARIDLLCCANEEIVQVVIPGKRYLGLCSEDEQWYRVVVKDVDGDYISIHFIDFGNTDVVTKTSLREMPQDLVELPAIAFHCTLDGIGDNVDVTETFSKIVTLPVSVQFVKLNDTCLCVRLYTGDGEDINQILYGEEIEPVSDTRCVDHEEVPIILECEPDIAPVHQMDPTKPKEDTMDPVLMTLREEIEVKLPDQTSSPARDEPNIPPMQEEENNRMPLGLEDLVPVPCPSFEESGNICLSICSFDVDRTEELKNLTVPGLESNTEENQIDHVDLSTPGNNCYFKHN